MWLIENFQQNDDADKISCLWGHRIECLQHYLTHLIMVNICIWGIWHIASGVNREDAQSTANVFSYLLLSGAAVGDWY